jgi:hypothetical protein
MVAAVVSVDIAVLGQILSPVFPVQLGGLPEFIHSMKA